MKNKALFKLYVKADNFEQVREVLQEDNLSLSIDIIQGHKKNEYKVTGRCNSDMIFKLLGLNEVDMIVYRSTYSKIY